MRWIGAIILAWLGAALLNASPAAAASSTVIALGDSLTAGYGLAPEEAFPVRLQQALKAQGHDVTVINAGVSGDTTAGGLARLDWTLADAADGLVIVELGANDALRGLPPAATRDNLDRIITRIKARGLKVLLAGMLAPPNMGDDYAAAFNAIYPELARKHGVAFDPFFLKGVAARPELNQADGMHPTAAGVTVIAERLAPLVIEALKQGR